MLAQEDEGPNSECLVNCAERAGEWHLALPARLQLFVQLREQGFDVRFHLLVGPYRLGDVLPKQGLVHLYSIAMGETVTKTPHAVQRGLDIRRKQALRVSRLDKTLVPGVVLGDLLLVHALDEKPQDVLDAHVKIAKKHSRSRADRQAPGSGDVLKRRLEFGDGSTAFLKHDAERFCVALGQHRSPLLRQG